jgi:hypothetical protein
MGNADPVCLQHDSGSSADSRQVHTGAAPRVKIPVVTTLHTVLRDPEHGAAVRCDADLIARSTRLVVMAERGRQIMHDVLPGSS